MLGVDVEVAQATRAPWHPGRCAEFGVDGVEFGHAGELHPAVCAAYGVPARTCAVEVDLELLIGQAPAAVRAELLDVPGGQGGRRAGRRGRPARGRAGATLREGAGELLESVRLFDVYGSQIGEGRKSLAFALRFRAPDRTSPGGDRRRAGRRRGAGRRAARSRPAVLTGRNAGAGRPRRWRSCWTRPPRRGCTSSGPGAHGRPAGPPTHRSLEPAARHRLRGAGGRRTAGGAARRCAARSGGVPRAAGDVRARPRRAGGPVVAVTCAPTRPTWPPCSVRPRTTSPRPRGGRRT